MLLSAALVAASAIAQPTPLRVGARMVEATDLAPPALPTTLHSDASQRARARHVDLPDAPAALLRSAAAGDVPMRVGVARAIDWPSPRPDRPDRFAWQTQADGTHVGLLTITAPTAAALRVGIEVAVLPAAAEVRFFSQDLSEIRAVSGAEIARLIRHNLAADASDPDARTYWSPVIDGETIGIEIHLPAGTSPDDLAIDVPALSHLLVSSQRMGAALDPLDLGDAAACNNDLACATPDWIALGNSVARMVFTASGTTYLCTGTLLNDVPGSGTPFFLTAHHCISSQAAASTLITYWFYRAAACHSGLPGADVAMLGGGALLLAEISATDSTFLLLNDTPPAGAVHAAWSTDTPAVGAAANGIHQPQGDLQAISYGAVAGFANCTPVNSAGSFSCTSSTSADGTHLRIQFDSGIVEPGSSGSGIFLGSNHALIGQLEGSGNSCALAGDPSFYGRFDVAFDLGALDQWLNPNAARAQLSVTRVGSGRVSSSPAGIGCGATCTASFIAGNTVTLTATPNAGAAFLGWSGDCAGTSSTCALAMTAAKNVTATFDALPDDDFPPAGQLPAGWGTAPGATAGWVVASDTTFRGTYSLKSSGIGNSQSAAVQVTDTYAAGTVAFAYAVSSEKGFDYLRFYIDGVQKLSASGTVPWTQVNYPVAAGTHTFKWVYAKDFVTAAGSDAAWIDAVVLPAAIPTVAVGVTRAGVGSGTVTSSPAGINCGATCTANFSLDSTVTLSAVPGAGSAFAGWSGGCTGASSNCVLTIDAAKSVAAAFTPATVIAVTQVAAGHAHSCVLTTSSGVKCWGDNSFGQLGDGTTTQRLAPVDVTGLASGVSAVAAGDDHTCALTSAGEVKCWGSNASGQLGDGTTTQRATPVTVPGLVSGGRAIAAGEGHTCAVSGDGGVKCWGSNTYGQLGDGTTTPRTAPVDVTGLAGGVSTVATGSIHTCALTTAGGVKCWGGNGSGQLGDGTTTQRLTPADAMGPGSGVGAIAAGSAHSCALAAGGAVQCWGDNTYGQLGDGTTVRSLTATGAVGLAGGASAMAAGRNFGCAVTADRGVKCWGDNTYGQIGDGTTTPRPAPVDATGFAGPLVAVAAGDFHACALTAGGNVKCWGSNASGQLGDGTTTQRPTAVDTVRLTGLGNYTGLWWNPDESGWGINLAHQGDTMYATWFTYDDAGNPHWLVAVLRPTAGGAYTGDVETVTGPPFNTVPWTSVPVRGTVVGTMTVTFDSVRTATLKYTVNGFTQTKAIGKELWGPEPICAWGAQADLRLATNYLDLWWNPDESGWGINLNHQADAIYATWFTYDDAGRPWWLVALLHQAPGGAWTGNVESVVGPPFNSVPWVQAQVKGTVVGTMQIAFADGSHGTLDYTLNGIAQTKAITREVWAPPGTMCR